MNDLLRDWAGAVQEVRLSDWGAFARKIGLRPKGEGSPVVVVGDQVGAELGRPDTASHALVLTTSRISSVEDGRIRWTGPDLDAADPRRGLAFAQVVILAHDPGAAPDPFDLEITQYLANRLPGYMVRTVPGRLWVRVDRDRIAAGLRLRDVGGALIAAYRHDFPAVQRAEAVLVTGRSDRVRTLDTIAAEVKVLSGKHRKLVLKEGGVVECGDLDCDNCDEKETCDSLRDVVVRYRQRGAS